MAEFYIEKSPTAEGEHTVHSATCSALPELNTMQYLGAFSNPDAPVNKSMNWYPKVSACPHCLTGSVSEAPASESIAA